MEKFFVVSNEHDVGKRYWAWKENIKIVNEHVKSFMDEQGIKAHEYHPGNEIFYIVPAEEDVEKFDKSLGKVVDNGLRPFKKNSTIHKAWIKSLTDNNLKILHKPYTSWYFKEFAGGKFTTRLFDVNGVIYTSFSWDGNKLDCPEGFTEIKASEFWKIIEGDEN